MVRLNRSMMERYEIEDRRPKTLRAALFGLDPMMLCAAARLLDRANARGGDLGAVCVTGSDEARELRAQDGMFTLLIRGEREDGENFREERVVQSILEVADMDAAQSYASRPELDLLIFHFPPEAEELVAELAVLTLFLHARWKEGLSAPDVVFLHESPLPGLTREMREGVVGFGQALFTESDFIDWLKDVPFQMMLVDSLFGELGEAEFAKAQKDLNYQDRFLLWAEPQLSCVSEASLPEELAAVCDATDFSLACERKRRVFDSLMFLCTTVGFLSGMDSVAQVLRDERLRSFIGHAFFDEILPELPWAREEISSYVISSFARLENSLNDVSLLHGFLMDEFQHSVLPPIRAHAKREFEAPPGLSLALAAAVMIYAGARKNGDDKYEILRGEKRFILNDRSELLEIFSRFAHDMPAESLAYAVLADRDLWEEDLREIDGLELRVALDIASIQRVGFRETLRQREN